MTKLSEARETSTRTQAQIEEAKAQIEKVDASILVSEEGLTNQLAKPDLNEETIDNLETSKERLEGSKVRLEKRIAALEKILPAQEIDIAKYELKSAVSEHKKLTEELNIAVGSYRTESITLARELADKGQALREQMEGVSDVRDKVKYFAAVLELEAPQLSSPDSLTPEDLKPLLLDVRRMTDFHLDPWRTSEYGQKLKKLHEEKREQEFVATSASKNW